MANKGKMNYCVRWDNKMTFPAAHRMRTTTTLQPFLSRWAGTLDGLNGFPLSLKLVSYAVELKSTF